MKIPTKWSAWFFQAFVFCIPFKTALFIYSADWGRGFSNPYLSFSFALPELFLILSGVFFFIEQDKQDFKKIDLPFALFASTLGAAGLSLLLSSTNDLLLKIGMGAALLELLLIYIMMANKVIKLEQFFKVLSLSMSLQAGLGLLQSLLGQDLGLSLLGEPHLNKEAAHLAHLQFEKLEILRAYGTFSHPNILGGFLAISILGTLAYPPQSHRHKKIHLGLQGIALLLTFSRSALLGLGIALLIRKGQKSTRTKIISSSVMILGLAFILFFMRPSNLWEDPAIQTRIEGYQWAVSSISEEAKGLGFGLETLYLDEISPRALKPWDYQPTHNILLLFTAETGWLGGILLLLLCGYTAYKSASKNTLFLGMSLVIFISGALDHYWISLKEGRFLAILILISLTLAKTEESAPKSPVDPPKKLAH